MDRVGPVTRVKKKKKKPQHSTLTAKQVYKNVLGFLGGISIEILAARIGQVLHRTSLRRKRLPLRPYGRSMPRAV